jgi:hypothetical protein
MQERVYPIVVKPVGIRQMAHSDAIQHYQNDPSNHR